MSDRIQSATVVFDKEYRTDDAEAILNALKMVKGVKAVKPGPVMDIAAYQARETVATEMGQPLVGLIIEAQQDSDLWKEIKEKLAAARKKRGY